MYSEVRITDAMLCVMITKVAPVSSWIFFTSSSRYDTRTGSRPESGSSKRMISGSMARARARPARFFMPPETSPGNFFMWSSIPTMSAFARTMSRISFSVLRVCSRSGKAMLSNIVMEPKSAPSWNSTPNFRRTW